MNEGINPAFDLIGLTQLRNDPQFEGIDGSGFSVAVIDTGINYNHELLAPNYVTGYDFYDEDSDPIDDQGHGTHVAGTVGANDETVGVAPEVGIIGLDVFPSDGGASFQDIDESLQWVLDNHEEHNIVSINMSLGGGFHTSEDDFAGFPTMELIDRLEREGVVVVSATGNSYKNDNPETDQTPNIGLPSIFSTIAVGSVWQDGSATDIGWASGAADFTTGADRIVSHGQRLDTPNVIFAPGALINSTSVDGTFKLEGGTSMASPHVAGAVALLQEASLQFGGRRLTPDEVVEILRSTADTVVDGDDEDDNVNNTGLSFPRMNIYNAVAEVKRRADGIAPPPPDDDDDPEEPIGNDPNGTIAGAFIGPILDGEPVEPIIGTIGIDGNETAIGDKDVDLISFEVESPGLVTIKLGTREDAPEDFDTYLRLFDESGTEIAFNDDIEQGIQQFSRLEAQLEPGTYYAGVSGYNNGSYDPNVAGSGVSAATGNYSLQFDLNNSDPNGLISGAVEVLLGNDREPLIFPSTIGADYGEPVEDDVDLYRIVVPDDGSLFVDIDTPYEEDYVDSFLRLFDEEGNELFFADSGEPFESDDDLSFDAKGESSEFLAEDDIVLEDPEQTTLTDGFFDENDNYIKGNYGHSSDSFLGVRVERGEVYYVGVSYNFNFLYDPTNLEDRFGFEVFDNAEGSYELIATFANNDLNGTITQVTSSTSLPLQDSQQNIGEDEGVSVGDRDVDFWKFNSAEAGILEIDIDSDEVDSYALLFDSEGRLLAENDDDDGLDPLLHYQIEADTDYWVAITGFGNQNFDPFASGSGLGGETGAYTINASLLDSGQFSALSDNSVNSEIQNITTDRFIGGDVGEDNGFTIGADDIDLYRFIPERNSVVNIRAAADEAFSADTFLRLFDSEGNEIAVNDNESELTRGSLIQQEVTAGTEYIIGVNGDGDNARSYNPITGEGATAGSTGSYTLSVTESNSEPSPEPEPNQSIELFRFRNTTFDTGTYIFVGEEERDDIQSNPDFNQTFELEGNGNTAFVASRESGDDLIPFYRLQSIDISGTYLFVSTTEYDAIFAEDSNQKDKWIQEGLDGEEDIPEFYLYEGSADSGTTFNRFQNTQNGTYLYAGESETEAINNNPNLSDLFVNQGVAFKSLS